MNPTEDLSSSSKYFTGFAFAFAKVASSKSRLRARRDMVFPFLICQAGMANLLKYSTCPLVKRVSFDKLFRQTGGRKRGGERKGEGRGVGGVFVSIFGGLKTYVH